MVGGRHVPQLYRMHTAVYCLPFNRLAACSLPWRCLAGQASLLMPPPLLLPRLQAHPTATLTHSHSPMLFRQGGPLGLQREAAVGCLDNHPGA